MNQKLIPKFALKPWQGIRAYGLASVAFALQPALAQNTPGAGSLLQQVEPRLAPLPLPSSTGLQLNPDPTPGLPSSAPFFVQRIDITGNTVFSKTTLQALVAQGEGKQLTLPQLGELTLRITSYYRSRGYPLARAIIPAQTISSGVVRIEVIEASYGKITLDNKSAVDNTVISAALSSLQSGQLIDQTTLDKALLQIGDVPGVIVGATLEPGAKVGTSDLTLSLTPGSFASGNTFVDNNGSAVTGRARVGATLNLLNPMQHGDVLSLSGVSSVSGMNYARVAYEILLNAQGFRLGGSSSALEYEMDLANGSANVQSLWAKQTLQRSRTRNAYAQLQFDKFKLRDHSGSLQNDRQLNNLTASLAGDLRDAFLAGAVSTWSLNWTAGQLGFDDAAAALANVATSNTQGRFSKANVSFARRQNLNASSVVYLGVSGQFAGGNLDSSQKMLAGGSTTVRAYDVGAVSGDTGYLAIAEWQQGIGAGWGGQWQAVAFMDSARVKVNKKLWSQATAANNATLSGAGLGLNWVGPQWSAKSYVAAPLGTTPTLVLTNKVWRGWVEVNWRF
jgi:hemolysin activation/secretion protein